MVFGKCMQRSYPRFWLLCRKYVIIAFCDYVMKLWNGRPSIHFHPQAQNQAPPHWYACVISCSTDQIVIEYNAPLPHWLALWVNITSGGFQSSSELPISCKLATSFQLAFCTGLTCLKWSLIPVPWSLLTMCESAKQERDTLIFMCVLTCSTDLVVTDYNAPLASLACTVIRHCSSWLPKPARRRQLLVVTEVAFLRHLYISGQWSCFSSSSLHLWWLELLFLRHLLMLGDCSCFSSSSSQFCWLELLFCVICLCMVIVVALYIHIYIYCSAPTPTNQPWTIIPK